MNEKIDVSQKTVFDLFLIGSFHLLIFNRGMVKESKIFVRNPHAGWIYLKIKSKPFWWLKDWRFMADLEPFKCFTRVLKHERCLRRSAKCLFERHEARTIVPFPTSE